MAKVTSPLHSLSASGSIGKLVTFTKTAAGNIAKRWSKPTDHNTALQALQREAYFSAIETWGQYSPEEKQIAIGDKAALIADFEITYPDYVASIGGRRYLESLPAWHIWMSFEVYAYWH